MLVTAALLRQGIGDERIGEVRRLYLLRHGKSDWDAAYGADHERPLAARGREAAKGVGRFLRELGQTPDLVVSSTAVRARSTAEVAAEAGAWNCPVRLSESLYPPSLGALLAEARSTSDEVGRLVLVGHEPTWSGAVSALTGGSAVRMVTAALARLDFHCDRWSQVGEGGATLVWLVTPKVLRAAGAVDSLDP